MSPVWVKELDVDRGPDFVPSHLFGAVRKFQVDRQLFAVPVQRAIGAVAGESGPRPVRETVATCSGTPMPHIAQKNCPSVIRVPQLPQKLIAIPPSPHRLLLLRH